LLKMKPKETGLGRRTKKKKEKKFWTTTVKIGASHANGRMDGERGKEAK